MTVSEEIGEHLRLLRKEKKITANIVANAVGMTLRSYQRYEAGTSNPSSSNLYALAEFFQVSLDYLTGRTSDRQLHR